MNYIKLAWRNIWRNKRRTIITASSVMFAIFFALIMRSYQLGTYQNMTESIVQAYTGFIQLHAKDFWKERTLDYLFENNDELSEKLAKVENVSLMVPRFESFALASAGLQTKVAIVTGIDPQKEEEMSSLTQKIIQYRITEKIIEELKQSGVNEETLDKLIESRKLSFVSEDDCRKKISKVFDEETYNKFIEEILSKSKIDGKYLSQDDEGVLIGDRMAKFLKLGVGDTLVLMGQGYHGASAAGKYPIRAIVRMPNPDLDNQMVYLPLQACQNLYSAENMLTSLSFNLKNPQKTEETQAEILTLVDPETYEVMTWREMLSVLVQQIESDNYSGIIMLWILYIIVGFGVFGTVLMMTAERQKEFGVMVALGMQKSKLSFIVFLELVILSVIGIFSGIILSLPIIRYYVVNPIELTGDMAEMMENFGMEAILPFAWQIDYFIAQSISVVVIILIAIIYPLSKIRAIKAMKALRG